MPKHYQSSDKISCDGEMIHTNVCPKCGGRRIAGPHRIAGEYHVRIDLPGFSTATLESFTCADCGYTELYADQIGLRNINTSGRFVLGANQTPLPQSERRSCPYCGSQLRSGALACHECGQIMS